MRLIDQSTCQKNNQPINHRINHKQLGDFWKKIKKPIIVLAPMADVTDAAFRRIIAKCGKPDAMWTEFVSADGLFAGGRKALMKDLMFTEAERPIVAQFFTSRPEMMEKAAALARELGFDGVDINMGCPDRAVERQGAGAALIETPKLAREIIEAAKKGADGLPVSIKTRTGFNVSQLETWLPELLAEEPSVVTIHARTRKEMSKVSAKWAEVKKSVEIRNQLHSDTLIFGNGDAVSVDDAKQKALETGCDGVMLGRAIFGNPWLFSGRVRQEISVNEKLDVIVEHAKLFEKLFGGVKNFSVMKKHFKAYVNGWEGAKELRAKLMETENAGQVEDAIGETKVSFMTKKPVS